MPHSTGLLLFLFSALVIAITPGPGILYVAARTLAGGRGEGFASSIGTGIGGLVHIVAGAGGVSALVMASAEAFTVLKIVGCTYLVWLGVKTFRGAALQRPRPVSASGAGNALRDGIIVEATNPKTAAFFLAFIPQFVDPAPAHVALQFIALGAISLLLNTAADLGIVLMTANARGHLIGRRRVLRRLRQGSGLIMCGLGVSLAFTRRAA